MNKVKYQIFVSSTYADLKDEREQVIKACLEMGHIPVGMEMFSAANEEQWQIITRQIDESDYYVLIIANRYGSTVEGISYTEKEYDYAVAQGVPVLGFVLDSSAAWPSDRFETGDEIRSKLEAFRQKVKRKPVNFWTNKEDLHGKCAVALMKTFNTQPRPGWVRTSETTGPEVAAELSRLSSENAELRTELLEMRKLNDTSVFAQGDDTIVLKFSVYSSVRQTASISISWNELFGVVAQLVLEKPQEIEVAKGIGAMLKEKIILKTPYYNPPEQYEAFKRTATAILDDNDLVEIKTQFIALNLIQIKYINHNLDVQALWALTSQGERLYASMRAKRR